MSKRGSRPSGLRRRWSGPPGPRRLGGDGGGASIWVLAAGALVVVVGVVVSVRATAVLARHRAEAAADLAALAAAGRIGTGQDSCAAAARVASANHARLRSCSTALGPSGRDGTVVVCVSVTADLPVVGARSAEATARAGRLPGG